MWAPVTLDAALAALHEADAALDSGSWVAGGLTYEFGAQLHGMSEETDGPLLLLGAFDAPRETSVGCGPVTMTAPLSRVSEASYARAIDAIVEAIRDGEVYQVNYTVPFDLALRGDPANLYALLAQQARAPYSALLQTEELSVLSLSPELFLRFDGTTIAAKPMKGTAPLDGLERLHDAKNRAEHVMIVDLLRNDLHRIAGRVRVNPLFEVETYPTFATMTSTVSATFERPPRFADAILATFPCGSVTGAPKRAAIHHIARLEQRPRGFYTGSIGFLSPQRRGWWNVPIRTLHVSGARFPGEYAGRFDAGGGIVADSNAADEWNEILLKSAFLKPAYERFSLLETFSSASDLDAHVQRLERSARAFSFPVDTGRLRRTLAENAAGNGLVRIEARAGGVTVTRRPLQAPSVPVDLCIAKARVRAGDPLLAHKTSWRPHHEAAALEAVANDCFDAILLNERGEVAEGSRTTIFARIGNTLYTPPLRCGVLPGILRSRLVSAGEARERALLPRDLLAADAVYAGNSARGLLPARIKMNRQTLYPMVLKPKLTPAIWGGDALVKRFGKDGDASSKLGESWECWDENAVVNGAFEGRTLGELRAQLGPALLGDLDPAHIFPLLTKIIDAQDSLSVQVHPDDAYARRVEHQVNGKTECWYVLDAKPGAELVMGWNKDTSRDEYERRVADGSLGDILRRVPVKGGDAFYIPAGTLHAIGAGIIIFETQQASDLTYRIFDWNRVGADGKPRELHVQKAGDVLDYRASTSAAIEPLAYAFEGFQRCAFIAESHFLVERVIATETAASMHTHGRPLIIMSLDAPLNLACAGGSVHVRPYQTAIVPAAAQSVEIETDGDVAEFMCVTPPASVEMLQQRFHNAGVAQHTLQAFLEQFGELSAA